MSFVLLYDVSVCVTLVKVRREFDNSEHKLTEHLHTMLAFVSFDFLWCPLLQGLHLLQFSVHGAFFQTRFGAVMHHCAIKKTKYLQTALHPAVSVLQLIFLEFPKSERVKEKMLLVLSGIGSGDNVCRCQRQAFMDSPWCRPAYRSGLSVIFPEIHLEVRHSGDTVKLSAGWPSQPDFFDFFLLRWSCKSSLAPRAFA